MMPSDQIDVDSQTGSGGSPFDNRSGMCKYGDCSSSSPSQFSSNVWKDNKIREAGNGGNGGGTDPFGISVNPSSSQMSTLISNWRAAHPHRNKSAIARFAIADIEATIGTVTNLWETAKFMFSSKENFANTSISMVGPWGFYNAAKGVIGPTADFIWNIRSKSVEDWGAVRGQLRGQGLLMAVGYGASAAFGVASSGLMARSVGIAARGSGKSFSSMMTTSEAARYNKYWAGYAPNQVTPGTSRLDWIRISGRTGRLETSRVIYDNYGRQIYRVDFSNHLRPSNHSIPHLHQYQYGPKWAINGKESIFNFFRQ